MTHRPCEKAAPCDGNQSARTSPPPSPPVAARSTPTGILLRYGNGGPSTSRRYDHVSRRIRQRLPLVAAQGVSNHCPFCPYGEAYPPAQPGGVIRFGSPRRAWWLA